jgi:hypothetical protein
VIVREIVEVTEEDHPDEVTASTAGMNLGKPCTSYRFFGNVAE